MLKNILAATALIASAAIAVPASAAVFYDAFTSFDGTQGAGNFSYGSFSAVNQSFTPFGAGMAGCAGLITNTICLGGLPGVFKTTAGAHTSGSVIVPDDRLIVHPGNGDDAVYVEFTAPTLSTYVLLANFSVQDTNPSGLDISFFLRSGGVLQFIDPVDSLGTGNLSASYFDFGPLAVGDSVGFIFDKQGVYFNDSTGLSLGLVAVPEPDSWVMLIAGFGITGAVMRRRRAITAS